METEFRFATDGDVAAVVALVNAAFVVEKFFKVGERTDADEIRHHLETGRFLLLEEGGELLGSVYLEVRGEGGPAGQRSGYLGMLSVAPGRQKRGIGTRLMAAGEEFFREMRCGKVEISVVNLRTELPGLYAKYGYVVVGTAPFPMVEMPVSQPCSFVLMEKVLG